jgi:hypothetical protein
LKILAVDRKVTFYRPASDPGAVYAVTTFEDPIYKIRSSDVRFLDKNVFALRDKSVIHLADQGEVDKIEVERDGGNYKVVRSDGKWTLSGAASGDKLDDTKISHLLATLQTAQAEQFIDQPSPEKAALSPPRARVVLKDKSGKTIDELILGKEERERLFARSNGQPTPFLVGKGLLDAVPKKEDLAPKTPSPTPQTKPAS